MKSQSTEKSGRLGAVARKLVIVGSLLAVSAAIVCTCFGWCAYRLDHVVVRDAKVNGVVSHVGARIEGRIQSVLVDPGQFVAANEVMIVMENDHIRARLGRVRAELASAESELIAARLDYEQEEIRRRLQVEQAGSELEVARARIDSTQSNLDRLHIEFERLTSLNQSGVSSLSDLDSIKAQRLQSLADLAANRAQKNAGEVKLRLAETDYAGLKVVAAGLVTREAQVSVAAERVAELEAELAATYLRAPEDGWVIDRIVEPGGSARVGEPILAMWLGNPWVEAMVPEGALGKIVLGNAVDIEIAAYPTMDFSGHVIGFGVLTDKIPLSPVAPAAAEGLFAKPARVPVKISLPPMTENRFQPGLTVMVGIEIPEQRIPRIAGVMNRALAWIQSPWTTRPEPELETAQK